jgi:hypothetical protein
MKTQKQQRLYDLLITLTVVLLLVAQSLLLYTFRSVNEELVSIRSQLSGQKKTQEERLSLVQSYQAFELIASRPGRQDAAFPTNALELYTMVDGVLTAHSIEHTNRSSTGETAPGSEMRLQITFHGPYYNILKALAAFRDGAFVMRVADFNITGQADGTASGSMTIVSLSKQN